MRLGVERILKALEHALHRAFIAPSTLTYGHFVKNHSPVSRKVQFELVDVTPAPTLSGFDRSHDWMLGRMEVLGRVSIFRRITATNVPAAQAQAKVHPPVAHLQTLFTTSGMRFDGLHLIEMSTLGHCNSPSFESLVIH